MPNVDEDREGLRVSFDLPPQQQRVFEEPSRRLSGVGRGVPKKVRSLKGPGTECVTIRKVPLLRDTPASAPTLRDVRDHSSAGSAAPTLHEEPVMPRRLIQPVPENSDGVGTPDLGEDSAPPLEPGLRPRGRAKRTELVHPNVDSGSSAADQDGRPRGRGRAKRLEATPERTSVEDPRGPRPGLTSQPSVLPRVRSFDLSTEPQPDMGQTEWSSAHRETAAALGSQDLGSLDVPASPEGGTGSESTHLGEVFEDHGSEDAPTTPTAVRQPETFQPPRPRPILRLPVPKRTIARPIPPPAALFRTSTVSGGGAPAGIPFRGRGTMPPITPKLRQPRPKVVPRPPSEFSSAATCIVGTAGQLPTASAATTAPSIRTNLSNRPSTNRILTVPRLAANFSALPQPPENVAMDRNDAAARHQTLATRSNTLPRQRAAPTEKQSVGVGVGVSLLNLAPLLHNESHREVSTDIPEARMGQSVTRNYVGPTRVAAQHQGVDGRDMSNVVSDVRDTVGPSGTHPGPLGVADHGQFAAHASIPATGAYRDMMGNHPRPSGYAGTQDHTQPAEVNGGATHSTGASANVKPLSRPATLPSVSEYPFIARGGSGSAAHHESDRWALGERLDSDDSIHPSSHARDRVQAELSGGFIPNPTYLEWRPRTGRYMTESEVASLGTLSGSETVGSQPQGSERANLSDRAREVRSWRTLQYTGRNERRDSVAERNEVGRSEPQGGHVYAAAPTQGVTRLDGAHRAQPSNPTDPYEHSVRHRPPGQDSTSRDLQSLRERYENVERVDDGSMGENRGLDFLSGLNAGGFDAMPPYGSRQTDSNSEAEGTEASIRSSLRPSCPPGPPRSGYRQPGDQPASLDNNGFRSTTEDPIFMNFRPDHMPWETPLEPAVLYDHSRDILLVPSNENRHSKRSPLGRLAATALRSAALLPEQETRPGRPTHPVLNPTAREFQPASAHARPNPYSDYTDQSRGSFDQTNWQRYPPADWERDQIQNREFVQNRLNHVDLYETGSDHAQGYQAQGRDERAGYVGIEAPNSAEDSSLRRYGDHEQTVQRQSQPRDISQLRQEAAESRFMWPDREHGFLPHDITARQSQTSETPDRRDQGQLRGGHSGSVQSDRIASLIAQFDEIRNSLVEMQGGQEHRPVGRDYLPSDIDQAQDEPQSAMTGSNGWSNDGRSAVGHPEPVVGAALMAQFAQAHDSLGQDQGGREGDGRSATAHAEEQPLSERIAALQARLEEVLRK